MDRILHEPPRPGTIHRFEVRFPDNQAQTIDYVDEDTIHLHVSLRPAKRLIVLNDFTGGRWNRQVELPLPQLEADKPLPLELHFGVEKLEVRSGDHGVTLAERRGIVSEANRLRCSPGVSVTGGITDVAPSAPAIDRPPAAGPFAGAIDRCSETLVRGWAADLNRPGHPVEVEILVNGRVEGQALAHRPRNDLIRMQPELGSCGFLYRFARPLQPHGQDVDVVARIAGRPVELAHSPWPVYRATPATPQPLRPAGESDA